MQSCDMRLRKELLFCRLVECAFGRLKSKFRILHANDKYNDAILFPMLIKTLCALHNFLSREEGTEEPMCRGAWCSNEEEDNFQQDMLFAHPAVQRTAAEDAQQDHRGSAVREKLRRHVEQSQQYKLRKVQEEALLFE
jgi:hypothetical protein